MTGVLCARAEAVIHSSLCLFGKRKGSLWLVTWETERGFSGGGQASWLSLPEQPRRMSVCVSGEQRGPWYSPWLAAGHPWPPALHLPLAPSAQALPSRQGQP